jgi:hypothetical protein
MFLYRNFWIKYSIIALIIFGAYFKGWNSGYDVGVTTKTSDDIIRGNVVCHYLDKKCNGSKSCSADTYTP